MPTAISYGVLILNERDELLVAHITGQTKWDIPKGGAEFGETPLDSVVRETFEETGIRLDAARLRDLGRHAYLPSKDLHLFFTRLDASDCDIAACACTSFFPHHRTGKPTPEVDDFRWIYIRAMETFCSPRLVATVLPLLAAELARNKTD